MLLNTLIYFNCNYDLAPVPVAVRSKAQVFGRSPAEIVGFESHREHGYFSVMIVVCCQAEVSATS